MDVIKRRNRGGGETPARSTDRKQTERRVRAHPLFLAVGAVYCVIGRLPEFLLATVVALQHECAHAFAAARLGYGLNRIVLMPYGAVIDGDLTEIGFKDEIFVAIAGPLCNLLTAAGFVAHWWLFPDTYAFTDSAAWVSLGIAAVNLIPAYPLDGGRVLNAALSIRLGEKRAGRICKGITLVFSALLLSLFAAFCFQRRFSPSLLLFGLFLGVGAFGNGKDSRSAYCKLNFSSREAFLRGVEIKRVAVDGNCSLRRAIGFIERGRYLVLDVYDEKENYLGTISQNGLAEAFERGDARSEIREFLKKQEKNRYF